MSLAKLKEKLTLVKEQIDAAEEREAEAKSLLKEATECEERNLSDAEALKRRIRLLKAELDKVLERVDEQEERLSHICEKGKSAEKARKMLEENEVEGDEKMSELEESINEAVKDREEKNSNLIEAQRRLVVVQRDLNAAIEREEKNLKTVFELKETLRNYNERTRNLEDADEEASEREQETEEKVRFLGEAVKEAIARADNAEREKGKLERMTQTIDEEISSWAEKKQQVEDEMRSITDIADEI